MVNGRIRKREVEGKKSRRKGGETSKGNASELQNCIR